MAALPPDAPDTALDYERMVETALRSVVRTALKLVVAQGLPGEHHFYITFRTAYPGVQMPDALRGRYPHEITIVLQHQYWDLRVFPDRFHVSLSFGGVPAMLSVPFAAVSQFADPSVKFGLQFVVPGFEDDEEATEEETADAGAETDAPAGALAPTPLPARPAVAPSAAAREAARSGAGAPHDAPEPPAEQEAAGEPGKVPTGNGAEEPAAPQVVSLDAFRRRGPAGPGSEPGGRSG